MVSFRKKQQGTAEIRLSQEKQNKASFLTNEIIVGTVVFRLPNGADFDHSKVALKGTVKTTTEEPKNGSLQRNWRTEKLDFLAVSLDSKARTGFKSEDGIVRIPFRFDLRDCERLSTLIAELPPSLDSKEEGHRSSDNQYSVSYNIVASAFSTRGLITSTTQRISILSVSQDAPTRPSDFPGENFWAELVTMKLRGSHAKHPTPNIDVAGQEPQPIVMLADDAISEGTTDIPFVIKLSPQGSGNLDQDSLPDECHLSARLVTKTHITPDGMRQIVSSADKPRYIGESETSVHRSHEQEAIVKISSWGQYSSSPTEPFALAKFRFQFNIDGEKPPLPTFSTPLLSRKYAIEVTLSFPSSAQSLKLSLPLEIVAEADDAYSFEYKKLQRVPANEARL